MEFNVEKVTEKIIEDIKDYYRKSSATGAVIGLSGGKDSAVVASLLVKALGSENVIGFWLPCNSKDTDKEDAFRVADSLGIRIITHDLTSTYEKMVNEVINNINIINYDLLNNANINIKPRLRTNILYYYASYFSSLNDSLYLVVGTSNKSEIYVGYYTKGGDNICDISPIKHLYVDEVIKVGDYLNMVPEDIIHKEPSDGLSGQTDEEKLGFSYSDVKKVAIEEETGNIDKSIDPEIRKKIQQAHKNNLHKLSVPEFGR